MSLRADDKKEVRADDKRGVRADDKKGVRILIYTDGPFVLGLMYGIWTRKEARYSFQRQNVAVENAILILQNW